MFIEDLPLQNQTVLLRVDFNVPLQDQQITDSRRIDLTLPTIRYLLDKQCRVVLLSHLGRPQNTHDCQTMSLAPVCEYLNKKLQASVKFLSDSYGTNVQVAVQNLTPGSLLILENTRFNDLTKFKESIPSPHLAQFWANLADFYVYDAFATAHRRHTSTFTILDYFPATKTGYGYLVRQELKAYQAFLQKPRRPFVAIIGGGKPASKIPLIAQIATWVDKILICGALSYPFLKVLGYEVGKNFADRAVCKLAATVIRKYRAKIVLPDDFATTKSFMQDQFILKSAIEIAPDDLCLDCGPATLAKFATVCQGAQAIFWNGPPGVFEHQPFAFGTKGILALLTELVPQNVAVFLGGGDSAAAAAQFGYLGAGFTHISTGGGAGLMLLQKKPLPVLAALKVSV